MIVAPGSTDVTTYFKLVDPATGVPETGVTISTLDATYVRDRAAAVKADLTALDAADSAHSDNKGIEVDGTNAPGLYRIDWPDAAFASGVSRVQLVVNGAAIDPAVIEVELAAWVTPITGATVRAVTGDDAALAVASTALANTTWTDARAGYLDKASYLPAVAAGAAGGVFIAGTNAATAITTAGGAALTLSSTGANGAGLSVAGNGSGAGILVAAGATGDGVKISGGATSGDGLHISATDGDGADIRGGTNGDGLSLHGDGSGDGLSVVGGATGDGLKALGGATSGSGIVGQAINEGHGIYGIGDGAGDGMSLVAGATGVQFDAADEVAGAVRTELATELAAVTTNLDAAVSTRSTLGGTAQSGDAYAVVTNVDYGNSALHTHVAAIPTNPYTGTPPSTADIKTALEIDGGKLDHLWEMTEDDSGVRRLTTNALEQAPTGGSAPTAEAIADAVWNELETGHTDAGKAGAQVWTDVDAILADTGTDGVQVAGLKQAALADLFDTDSGTTYAAAAVGSVVKEVADNAGGSTLTPTAIWAYGTRTLTEETTTSTRTASPPLRVGDVGATLRLTFLDQDGTPINLAAASTKQIKLRSPAGVAKTKTATLAGDGTDGVVQYLTVAGDIDEAGVWRIQGYAVTSAWTGHTSVSTFEVEDNL